MTVGEIIVNRVRRRAERLCPSCTSRVAAEAAVIQAIRTSFPRLTILYVPQSDREPRGVAEFRRAKRDLQPVARWVLARKPVVLKKRSAKVSKTPVEWAGLLAPPGCRLVLFAGKGGVGKTTCAAGAAVVLAQRSPGHKILLLSTDPAHSLGDVFQMPLDDSERAMPGLPRLRVQEMDARSLFQSRRERYQESINELFDTLRGDSRFDVAYDRAVTRDLIDLSPPGIDEIFGILSVSEALLPRKGQAARYDLVVLPATALQWVRTLLSILLKYRKVTGLGALATDLLELARQLRELLKLLHDPRQTRLVAVTRAAQLPLLETVRLLRKVRQLKIAVSAMIVNAVTLPTCAQCRKTSAVERREMETLPAAYPRILAPALIPAPRGIGQLSGWARSWERVKT